MWLRLTCGGAIVLMAALLFFYLQPQARPAQLTIETRPTGAKVLVGDQFCPSSPCTLDLSAGQYEIQASKEFYATAHEIVRLSASENITKTLRLTQFAPTPEDAGKLHFKRVPEELLPDPAEKRAAPK